jgi:hypothetical protein
MLTIQTNSELAHKNSIVWTVLNVTFVIIFFREERPVFYEGPQLPRFGLYKRSLQFCERDVHRENDVWSLATQTRRELKANMPPFCDLHQVIEMKCD